jgi:hypothetical protein
VPETPVKAEEEAPSTGQDIAAALAAAAAAEPKEEAPAPTNAPPATKQAKTK